MALNAGLSGWVTVADAGGAGMDSDGDGALSTEGAEIETGPGLGDAGDAEGGEGGATTGGGIFGVSITRVDSTGSIRRVGSPAVFEPSTRGAGIGAGGSIGGLGGALSLIHI